MVPGAQQPTAALRRAAALATGLAVGIAALAGCSTDGAAAPAPAGVDASALSGTLAQTREDEVRGVAVVRLVSTRAATVVSLRLDWPGLAPAPATTTDYPLAPGVPVDLPVAYGPAVCGTSTEGVPLAAADPPTGPPSAEVVLAGSAAPTVVVLADPGSLELAQRLHARSCRAQALDAAVGVALGPTWTPTRRTDGSPGLAGTLLVTRRVVGDPVRVVGLEGSVLLAFEPRATLPTEVSGARLVLPVVVGTSGRCDGHALGEAKKTYELTVLVSLGDAEAAAMPVSPDPAARPQLWRTLLAGCAAQAAS